MGLDTTSFAKLEAMPADFTPPRDEWGDVAEGYTRACTYDSFPDAMDGIEGGHEPDPEFEGMIGSRWYRLTEPGPTTQNSYMGHGAYREALIDAFWTAFPKFVSDESTRGEPFRDLIWFADNQGLLGPVACARLVEAFDAHPTLPDAFEDHQEYHDAWSKAVRHAAAGGAVRFQ